MTIPFSGNSRDMSDMSDMSDVGEATDTGATPAASSNVGLPPNDPLVPGLRTYMPAGHGTLPFCIRNITTFPDPAWHPKYRAQAILAEFATTPWLTAPELDPGDWNKRPDAVEAEIRQLLRMAATDRGPRMSEIMAEATDASPLWANLLLSGPAIRPNTWTLVLAGQVIGTMVAMHFKYKYKRPRPAQVYPAIMPPVITPSHPSYPNAHALQSHLMSGFVTMACSDLKTPLAALADRVGQNREIAGLHYPSDRVASEHLAKAVLRWCDDKLGETSLFKTTVAAAAGELSDPPSMNQ